MKILIKNTVLILLVICLPLSLHAQKEKVHFTKITLNDGLPQNHIFGMTQDSDGYVWVCTMDGLGKYNGKQFENYKNNINDSTSIPSSFVYKYFEDSKGRSYVATTKGFAEFNKEKGTFTTYKHFKDKNSLSSNVTRDILETSEGEIIIATGSGVDLFNPVTKEFTNYTHPKFGYGRLTSCLLYDNKHQIWAGSVNGLYKIVKGQSQLKYYPLINDAGKELNIFNLIQDSYGTIWVGSNRGLYIFYPDKETFQLVDFGASDIEAKPAAMIEYPKGNLYIGTDRGLFYWNIKSRKLLQSYVYATDNPEGITVNSIYSLMKDNKNNIWLGLFSGINIINPEAENFNLYYNFNGLNNQKNIISKIFSDTKGRLWTNTLEGFFVKDKPSAEPSEVTFEPQIKSDFKNIKGIAEDSNQAIWISTANDGLFILSEKTKKFIEVENYNFFNQFRLNDVLVDNKEDETLWLATEKGLCKYNTITRDTLWIYPKKMSEAVNNKIGSLVQHPNGSLWFVNSSKLCVYQPEKNTLHYFKTNKEDAKSWYSGKAFNMVINQSRIYLSGDSFSYFDIKKEEFTNFTSYNTLGEHKLGKALSVIEANNGHIWFNGDNSIWEFNPETEKLIYHNPGQQIGEFMTNTYGKAVDGKLFFGANNGILEINPNKPYKNNVPPKVVLSNFKISNKDTKFDVKMQFVKSVELKNEDNIFSIAFTALQFKNQNNLNYRYQLKGFDKDWVDAQFKNEVTYTNLSPGDYTFMAEAINSEGFKSEKPLVLDIYIEPYFWQTNIFYFLVFIGFSIIVFLIYLNRKRVQQLKQEKLVAEQNSIYKSKFLANMSHEFRTPMNAIMGLNKLMLTSNLTNKQQEYAKGIDASCDNLLWIINDILDQSKIESGKMTIRNQPFNLREVVDQISLLLKTKMNEKELNFNVNIDDKVPNLLIGDPTRLFQILTNLVGNAIKFTEKGSIHLNIKLANKTIKEALIIFEVIDTGIGIPKHKLAEIFKSFEQVFSTKNNQKYFSEGTGLGLSISKELVEQMGGEIHLESEINKGSKFYFNLNFKKGQEQPTTSEEKIEELQLPKNLRILLVDDTHVNRFLVIELLKQHLKNVQVDIAENGKIALKKIESKNYDLVLMDIKMPVMDGLEATKLIRSKTDDYYKKVPILGLTANAIPQQLQEAKNVGMNACIIKPIYVPELLSSIDKVLKI